MDQERVARILSRGSGDHSGKRTMDKQHWYDQRDDRTLRYGARRLDHSRWIAVSATPEHLRRYDGQVAAIVAANLLSRMTPSVAISFPDVELHPALPWRG